MNNMEAVAEMQIKRGPLTAQNRTYRSPYRIKRYLLNLEDLLPVLRLSAGACAEVPASFHQLGIDDGWKKEEDPKKAREA